MSRCCCWIILVGVRSLGNDLGACRVTAPVSEVISDLQACTSTGTWVVNPASHLILLGVQINFQHFLQSWQVPHREIIFLALWYFPPILTFFFAGRTFFIAMRNLVLPYFLDATCISFANKSQNWRYLIFTRHQNDHKSYKFASMPTACTRPVCKRKMPRKYSLPRNSI
jgi:hypothetical protein